MFIENRKICEIELTPEELSTLANASNILEKIVDVALKEGVAGFKVVQEYEDYTLDELSTCMVSLNELSHPYARLVGYFDEYNN